MVEAACVLLFCKMILESFFYFELGIESEKVTLFYFLIMQFFSSCERRLEVYLDECNH